jgi:phosphotransferase system HPr (HPr) family protein
MLLHTEVSGSMLVEARVFAVLNNRVGLHCRPAGAFVRIAKRFRSEVKLTHGGKEANGKSILEVMGLEAGNGALVVVKATGDDAQEAVQVLRTLIRNKFGEPD